MKKRFLSKTVKVALLLTTLAVQNAYAVPSFARQTGLDCASCHAGGQFPALTEMGRQFKLTGYTMGGGDTKMPLPLSAMIQVAYSNTKNGSNDTAVASTNGVNENNKVNVPQMSIFYGGKIYDKVGAFVQVTYDSSDLPNDLTTRRIAGDNADIRYADTTTLLNNSLIYGASLNNNPTVQDIYASTPVWGFPWATPGISAGIPGPMIEGLGGSVVGLSAYAMYDNTFYVELGGYQDAHYRNDILKNIAFNGGPVGSQAGNDGYLNSTAPYVRIAYQKTFGDSFAMIGGYGSQMDFTQIGTTQLDRYTDIAIDGEYQYIAGKHTVTLTARNTWETQKLTGSYAVDNTVVNLNQSLLAFSSMAAYTYDTQYGINIGYNDTKSTSYIAGNSQDSSDWIIELCYTPIQNIRFVLQDMIFTKLNPQLTSLNGTLYPASDSNTISLGAWFMF